jgi:hypothetical protein
MTMQQNDRVEMVRLIMSQIDRLRDDPNEGGYIADILGATNAAVREMELKAAIIALQIQVAQLSGTDVPPPPTATVTHLRLVKDQPREAGPI